MKLTLGVAIFLIYLSTSFADKARYDNYRVYNIRIENQLQLRVLKELSDVSDSYNFWDPPSRVGSTVDLVVPPHQYAHFGELVDKFGLKAELTVTNMQELIDNERPKKQPKADGELNWTDYHSFEDIYDWLDALESEFPQFVTVEEIGRTYEGRPFKLVKLSKQQNNRAIFIEANIHAREWIASATATYILNELLRSDDPVVLDMALNIDWYIVPIMNPDGFVYTHNENRNWRKSRSAVSLLCYGVDPNRNFEYNWLTPDEGGDLGASRAPCSDTYAGSYAFSENETLAVDNYLSLNSDKFDVYLSLHSYGHMVLHPFGHRRAPVSNADILQAIGDAAAEKIASIDGIEYDVGNWNEVLYASSGVSVDHAYGHHNIPLGYTFEMRGIGPYGNFGFFLPAHFIIPNGEEIVAGLGAFVAKAREFGYLGN